MTRTKRPVPPGPAAGYAPAENHIYRMRDGQIGETWSEASSHHLLAQLTGKV